MVHRRAETYAIAKWYPPLSHAVASVEVAGDQTCVPFPVVIVATFLMYAGNKRRSQLGFYVGGICMAGLHLNFP